MRARFDNGAQCKSGEFRAAANVIGLAFEHISVGVTQQKGGIGLLISTLRRGCVRPSGEIPGRQGAPGRGHQGHNAGRARSPIGRLPPCEFRLWERNDREESA